jgi:hypothetical protein
MQTNDVQLLTKYLMQDIRLMVELIYFVLIPYRK